MKVKFLIVTIFFIPFIVISFFNQPSIDDFWNANVVVSEGRLGATLFFFKTVSGRYLSLLLMGLLNTLPRGEIYIFKIWPILTLCLLAGSQYFLYNSLLPNKLCRSKVLFASLLFVCLHVINMRNLYQVLYWMSSAICYQLAIVFFSIGIGATVRCIKNKSIHYAVLAISCSFLLPGTVESIAPAYLLALIGIFFYAKANKLHYKKVLAPIAAACIGIGIALISAGNLQRVSIDSLSYHQDLWEAFILSCKSVLYYCFIWSVTPANVCALAIVVCYQQKYSIFPAEHYQLSSRTLMLLFLALLILSISIYLPLHLFESDRPFPRLTSLFFFIGSCSFAISGYFLSKKFLPLYSFIKHMSSNKRFVHLLWAIFFASTFFSCNFIAVVKDVFSGTAYNYNREANLRFTELKNSVNDTCYIPYFQNWPSSIAPFENERDGTLIHVDKYFNKTILYKK